MWINSIDSKWTTMYTVRVVSKEYEVSQDSQTVTTTHDDGTFIRTAIRPQLHSGSSITILGRNGQPAFTVNLFASGCCTTIDVIPAEDSVVMHRLNGNVDWTHSMGPNEVNTTFVDHEVNNRT